MKGPGAMIALELKGGMNWAIRMMESVGLFTPAVSLGSTDSLIQHPAGLTHRIVDEEGQKQGGIGAGLIRLSIGLEHVDDLWQDLNQALEAAQNEPARGVILSRALPLPINTELPVSLGSFDSSDAGMPPEPHHEERRAQQQVSTPLYPPNRARIQDPPHSTSQPHHNDALSA